MVKTIFFSSDFPNETSIFRRIPEAKKSKKDKDKDDCWDDHKSITQLDHRTYPAW